MIPKPPKPGDVFCVYNRTLKAYTASQVTMVKEKGVVELDLDWVGDEPLTPEELPALRPLMVDFLFWSRGYSLYNVPLVVPGNYRYVGNIPPLCEDDSRSYSGWGGGHIIARQRWWDSIPADRRRAFKEAAASKGGVEVAGRTVRERESKLLDKLLPFGDARELQVLPCLTTLECVQWHPGLREYLASTPFLMTLRLENHGQKTLDLRGTSVQQLIVDPDGLEELWLGENTGSLVFLKQEKAPSVIHAPREGEGVGIVFHQEVTRHPELPRLTSVHCTRVEQLDIQALADWYPGLLTLRLWGKPGYLRNIGALKDLTRLEHFTTVDLFGFGRDEVPKPEEMPCLTWLWMSSLPAAAARQVKQLYRKRQGLDLWITKPRKPEWRRTSPIPSATGTGWRGCLCPPPNGPPLFTKSCGSSCSGWRRSGRGTPRPRPRRRWPPTPSPSTGCSSWRQWSGRRSTPSFAASWTSCRRGCWTGRGSSRSLRAREIFRIRGEERVVGRGIKNGGPRSGTSL